MLKLKRGFEDSPIGLNGYAKLLGVSGKTLYNKLTGTSDFSYPEYLRLKSLLPKYNIDYLLTEDQIVEDPALFVGGNRSAAQDLA